jgi:hypothetical protein
MRRLLLVLTVLGAAIPRAAKSQVEAAYPPPFPRPGTVLMLENDRVLVWNIAWLEQAYPVHRHQYDHVGVYYTAGDRIITSLEGVSREAHTEPWNITFQLRDVTHAEQGASDEPLRAVFIQIKDEPRPVAAASGSERAFPVDGPTQRLENDRALVWEYAPGHAGAAASHRHIYDAVVVSFDGAGQPHAQYVARGTRHDTDVPAGSTRTFVFEIR